MLPAVYLVLALAPAPQASAWAGDPYEIVLEARRALAADRTDALQREWSERLARDSNDRAAILGLATLARLTYDYPGADSLYEQLLARDAEAPDRFAVYARLGHAEGLQWRGEWRGAGEEFERAAEEAQAAGDAPARARALLRAASLRSRTHGPAAARELLVEGEELIPSDDLSLQALNGCAGGPLRGLLSEVEAGAEIAERAGDWQLLGTCLQQLAQHQQRRGRVDSALSLLGRADEVQRWARDRAGRAATLQWAGYLQNTIGGYGLGRQMLQSAILEGEASGNLSPVAWAYLNLAVISLKSGDLGTAVRHVERAAQMLDEQGDLWGRAAAQGTRAEVAAAAGRTEEARQLLLAALERYEELGNAVGIVGAHTGLADLAMAEGDPATAKRELDAARATARARGMPGWDRGLDFLYAEVALAQGDLDEAERSIELALAGVGSQVRKYRTLVRRAELYALRGEIDLAEADLTEAIDALDTWRGRLDREGLRRYAFQFHEHSFDPDLGVATILAALVVDGRADVAFRLADRQRARSLLDQLVRADALRAADDNSVPEPPAPWGVPAGIDVTKLASSLPDDSTALLEYVIGQGGEPTTLFVVTRTGLSAYQMAPIDSLAADVDRFRALTSSDAEAASLGRKLRAALLGPALSDLPGGVHHLVIVADGILHHLPFDALRLEDQRLLIERYTVSLVPSAIVALEIWARRPRAGTSSLLALADPQFAAAADADAQPTGEAEVLRAAFAENGGLQRLRGSRREVEIAARLAERAEVRLRDRASESYLKRADLEDYRILHFATHALVDDHSLARTALALAPGDGEDGFLGPGDLAALRLDADLVILSGCRTAAGVVVRGEGVYGLTAPLLEAGARSVLATNWRIGDRAAARLVEMFYRGLAEGRTVGDALRAAKLAALRRGDPASEWAAFTLVGDASVRVPLELPTRGLPIAAALGVLVLVGIVVGMSMAMRHRARRGSG